MRACRALLGAHVAAVIGRLIEYRDVLFAHRRLLPLRSRGVFGAVDALRLDGRQGLLAPLRRHGYRVARAFRRLRAEAR